MGLLADGAALLGDLQAETDGETVQLSRPGVFGPVPCTAVWGDTATVVDSSTNLPARTEADRSDCLIRAIDLLEALGLGVFLQKNDRIDRTVGTRNFRYVVVADDSGPGWEYGDPDQVNVRVHLRLVEVT